MRKENIAIILVEPEYPGNIGSAARAMKNMELEDLRIVNPPENWRKGAKIMAVFADDILAQARIYKTLKAALSDLRLTVGTTRRVGSFRGAFLEFDEAIKKVVETAARKKTGIVFGKESKGLSNEQLALCDWMMQIPSAKEYPSINLAQAVMITAFSLLTSSGKAKGARTEFDFLPKKEVWTALSRLDEAVRSLAYKPVVAERIIATFYGLIKRGGLLKKEAEMIKGVSQRIVDRFPEKLRARKK